MFSFSPTEWSREMLLEAWMWDAVACCEKCGVVPPSSVYSDQPESQDDDADVCQPPPPPPDPEGPPAREIVVSAVSCKKQNKQTNIVPM